MNAGFVSLERCTLTSSQAGKGGVMFLEGGTMDIIDSYINDSYAKNGGGVGVINSGTHAHITFACPLITHL